MATSQSVLLGIPVSDLVPGLFVGCAGQALLFFTEKGWKINQMISAKVPLDKAREDILRSALDNTDARYLLFVDSDMLLDHFQAYRLVDYLEKNLEVTITTGLYHKKSPPYGPAAFVWDEKISNYAEIYPIDYKPLEIDAAGMGAMAIRLDDIRQKLTRPEGKPYFWFDNLGEDINFCRLVRDAGMRIMLLPQVAPPHMGGVITTEI